MRFLFAVVAALMLVSCSTGDRRPHKPASKGLPYELVLIVPKALYEGSLRDSLDALLKSSTPVLPQHEPLFRLDVVYQEGNLVPWRTFRNRLLVDLGPADIGVARNAIARPQIEVKVSAPSARELAELIGANRQYLTDLFVDSELEVEAARLRRKYSRMTYDSLQRLSGHTICVPEGLHAAKVGTDFLWTGTNLNDRDQNFVFYSYPWDGQALSESRFVENRDSVMRVNIPGAAVGQWMQTARVPLPSPAASAPSAASATSVSADGHARKGSPLVLSRTRVIDNKVVLEVHGLWEMRGGALGGAFISMERVDTAARRVLVTEGFIYSPHSPKRNLMRQMEAALRTFH